MDFSLLWTIEDWVFVSFCFVFSSSDKEKNKGSSTKI